MYQLASRLRPVGTEWLVAREPVEPKDDPRGEGCRLGRCAVADEKVEAVAESEVALEEGPAGVGLATEATWHGRLRVEGAEDRHRRLVEPPAIVGMGNGLHATADR